MDPLGTVNVSVVVPFPVASVVRVELALMSNSSPRSSPGNR